MGNVTWSDLLHNELRDRFGENAELLPGKCSWIIGLHSKAEQILNPDYLASLPPQDIYRKLKELGIPECPLRIAHLGRVNDAQRIIDSLTKLLQTPGGLEEKYRAAKFPQAGMVTITELLCITRPLRFVCRNTAFTRELAKLVPLYSKKALDELPYAEFLDLCREMIRALEIFGGDTQQLAEKYRYLLLYAAVLAK